jgi:peptidyl-tRNA hydrolase, PTH1 family
MGFFSSLFAPKIQDFPDEMKFLIIGLGNPGAEYRNTRHNIGFMVLDRLAEKNNLTFATDRLGDTVTLRHKGKQLILLKPSTYMNLSGKAVRYHMQKHGIEQPAVLVITDDLALPFGKVRIRAKGSGGGHNGLGNIQEILGNENYARLRFGVGSEFNKGAQVDYVLSDFRPEEKEALPALLDKMGEAIIGFSTIGLERTMNIYNTK